MNSQSVAGDQRANVQLEQAFQLFNQFSEKLSGSYADLEAHVAHLTKELADARSERLKQRAEKELLATRLEGLLDALPAGIVVLDANECITQINPVAHSMLAGGKSNLIGNHWNDIAQQSFITGCITEGDELQLKDERWVSVSMRSLAREDDSTNREKIIFIFDITKTRILQNKLNQQQRLSSLGEMIAGLAHQIRTPLSSALLYLSVLDHPLNEEQERNEFSEKAKERLFHLERMVSEMLIFAKGDVVEYEYINAYDFMMKMKKSFDSDSRIEKGKLTVNKNLKNISIQANHDVLLSTLQNIIDNAIDACNNKLDDEILCIKIKASLNEKYQLEIKIKDNGCGMSDDVKEKILQPFYTTKSTGTGLGLAVVNATLNRYDGEIKIESEEKVGSCFTIMLPSAKVTGLLPSDLISRKKQINKDHFAGATDQHVAAKLATNKKESTYEVVL